MQEGLNVGFIGVGKMGSALVRSVRKASPTASIYFNSFVNDELIAFAKEMSAEVCQDKAELLKKADIIFIGVKPKDIRSLMSEVQLNRPQSKEYTWVSMATGIEINLLAGLVDANDKIIRIMPNTPVAVGQGFVSYALSDNVTKDDERQFVDLLNQAGMVEKLDESLFDAASAITGCGPAYMYMIMEALSDGGVRNGIPRPLANKMAIQLLKGSASLAAESSCHLGQLKDDVCSPGGSTIAAVNTLEDYKVRAAMINAVNQAVIQTKEISKKS